MSQHRFFFIVVCRNTSSVFVEQGLIWGLRQKLEAENCRSAVFLHVLRIVICY